MVHGLGPKKGRKKNTLTTEKDYLTEAYLHGGKAIGELAQSKKHRKKNEHL